jgi:hypothetical protein
VGCRNQIRDRRWGISVHVHVDSMDFRSQLDLRLGELGVSRPCDALNALSISVSCDVWSSVDRLRFFVLSLLCLSLILYLVLMPDQIFLDWGQAYQAFPAATSICRVRGSSVASTVLARLNDAGADTRVCWGCHYTRKTLHRGGANREGLAATTRQNCTCLVDKAQVFPFLLPIKEEAIVFVE